MGDVWRSWPDRQTFATLMPRAGFGSVDYRNLFAGIGAIHVGVQPRPGNARRTPN